MKTSGQRVPRLVDVARLANVSTSLVSRILNHDPTLQVREGTRAEVLAAVDMLGYVPDTAARALRSARTGLLGLALHHVNDEIYVDMVRSAQAEAAKHNYSTILIDAVDLPGNTRNFRAIIQGHRVDGMLIQAGFRDSDETVEALAAAIPSVVFGGSADPNLRTLRFDDGLAAQLATQHLLDLGHEAIAFIGANGSSSRRRYEGYATSMTAAGLKPMPVIEAEWSSDSAHAAVRRLLQSGSTATGLVAVTTALALGAHSAIAAAGLHMPTDISLVSVHDSPFARHLNPSLTVVELANNKIGRVGVAIVIEQMREQSTGETILNDPPPRLIQRGSSGPAPVRQTVSQ